jgi:methylenetetrahydrofolate dehydrogenase (NADP+)/methenyltetrahydrofolate cyclohydrolase
MLIDGRALARDILGSLKARPAPSGRLAILASDAPANRAFVARKLAAARELGIRCRIAQPSVRAVQACSKDSAVCGIVIQLPLPPDIRRDACIAALDPQKDVDNLTGRAPVPAPAASVVFSILRAQSIDPARVSFAVFGDGFLVGRPVCRALANAGARVALISPDTPNPAHIVRAADVVITCVGGSRIPDTARFDVAWIKDGAGVIDFGFPPDCDQAALRAQINRFSFATPTPHGTGPVLVAELLRNFYALCG